MTYAKIVEGLRADIAETTFEIRAKTRNLRDDLTQLLGCLDSDGKPFVTQFTGRAADIERNLGRMETAEEILKLLARLPK